jgi:hypothetical protein
VFKPCGALDAGPALGVCIPSAVVTATKDPRLSVLKQHECTTGELCVPRKNAENSKACFAHCTVTNPTVAALAGPAGACVAAFVVFDKQPTGKGQLSQETCQPGEVCAPCVDPLAPGSPSGACQ